MAEVFYFEIPDLILVTLSSMLLLRRMCFARFMSECLSSERLAAFPAV